VRALSINEWIAREDGQALRDQADFRVAAEAVAEAFAKPAAGGAPSRCLGPSLGRSKLT